MPYATTDELDVYYESHGEGRPLVLLHGGGGNHLAWWQQVPHFQDRYRVITIDFPGYGLSRSKTGEYDNAQYADAILAVLDHAGVDRALLLSQSAGSYGSLKLAVTHPERVAGAVMASNLSPVGDEISALDDIGRAAVRDLPVKDFLLLKEFQEKEPEKVFLFFQMGSINTTGPGRATPSRNSVKNSIRVQQIRDAINAGVHITFIQGTADLMMYPPAYDRLRELLPEANVEMVEGAPHSDYWENPKRFNSVVDNILERFYPQG
ncbi:alpha/beta hydrolase [Streptomyces sp. NPDC005538]|uniref:alpha/beta fold hydrolase n=1 Tax=unclassified Streptomyces TaxID=2593676 RepID=UPI0033AA5836